MILSIQSNVIHGYVGNRASLPLYQAFGIETDHLDTVRLAAHPGHGTSARDILDGEMMGALFDDYLKLSDASKPAAVHIGYFGALDQVIQTSRFITALKARYPRLIILLDPVFGDHGRTYVSDEIITAIIDKLLPLADIITPNQFELGMLTGTLVTTIDEGRMAAKQIGDSRSITVVGTGIDGHDKVADILYSAGHFSHYSAPKIARGVSGSGDAFAALFLSHIITGHQPEAALHGASPLTHHMIQNSKSPLTLNIASGLQEILKIMS